MSETTVCIVTTDISAGDGPSPYKVGISALREVVGQTEGETRATTYALTVGDGGGGTWQWTTDTTSTDNVGTIIVPNSTPRTGCWKRLYSGAINARWFGARGDGVTDDTNAIKRLTVFSGKVFFPAGTYLLSGTIRWIKDNIEIYGEKGSVIKVADNFSPSGFTFKPVLWEFFNTDTGGRSNVWVHNLRVVPNLSRQQSLALFVAFYARNFTFENMTVWDETRTDAPVGEDLLVLKIWGQDGAVSNNVTVQNNICYLPYYLHSHAFMHADYITNLVVTANRDTGYDTFVRVGSTVSHGIIQNNKIWGSAAVDIPGGVDAAHKVTDIDISENTWYPGLNTMFRLDPRYSGFYIGVLNYYDGVTGFADDIRIHDNRITSDHGWPRGVGIYIYQDDTRGPRGINNISITNNVIDATRIINTGFGETPISVNDIDTATVSWNTIRNTFGIYSIRLLDLMNGEAAFNRTDKPILTSNLGAGFSLHDNMLKSN